MLNENLAIVHGSEEDEVEQAGKRFLVRYVYMDVVMKRDGKWQIAGVTVGATWRDPVILAD